MVNILAHNRAAWDRRVEELDRWTRPVSPDVIAKARQGQFELFLTPTKPVPLSWFPELKGISTLCLASGGGQQGPLLAAAGAVVAVFDNSPKQLAQDELVAKREGLVIDTVEGDMASLSVFPDEHFALIVHPCSNCFVPEIRPVWQECFRVLRRGGILLAGFTNPVRYIFDDERAENGSLEVKHSIPYSDLTDLPEAHQTSTRPLEFGHTLEDQIGGQFKVGFLLTGFFEDRYSEKEDDLISRYLNTFIATRAVKPMVAHRLAEARRQTN